MANPLAGPSPAHTGPHTKWGRVFLLAVGAAIAVGVVVLAFLWPTVTSSVKDLPVAVTGPSAQVSAIEKALTKDGNTTFDLTTVDSRADAVHGIKQRTYDGAIVLSDSPEVLTASAASPVVTQIMTGVQGQLQKQINAQIAAKIAAAQKAAAAAAAQAAAQGQSAQGQSAQSQSAQQSAPGAGQGAQGAQKVPTVTVKLTDLAPFADTDSRGSAMTAAAFPLTIGGLIGGILISILVSGTRRRLVATTAYALVAGAAVVAVMQPWLGVLQGSMLLNWLAASLSFFATGIFIVGTTALLGGVGVAVGAVVTMLIGNPLASAATPVQFLPVPWGAIGQWFVPGASTTLLRDISYFPDANAVLSWVALGAWAVLGLLLSLIGRFRDRELVHPAGWDEEDAAAPHTQPTPAHSAA